MPRMPAVLIRIVAAERGQAGGAVPGALAGDPEAVGGREGDGLGDVLGALDQGDGGGSLVGGQVPAQPHLVPVGVGVGCDAAGDRQPGEVGHVLLLVSVQRQSCPRRLLSPPTPRSPYPPGRGRGRRRRGRPRAGRRAPPGRRHRAAVVGDQAAVGAGRRVRAQRDVVAEARQGRGQAEGEELQRHRRR